MSHRSKRLTDIDKTLDRQKIYKIEEAVAILQKCPGVKFDQSIECALLLGVDPKKSEQHVRGVVSLPHGTGKTLRIVAIARGEKVQEALAAGAVAAGADDLLEKIAGGWTEFDVLVTTPDMMREVGKLGKVLGPRGLMPTPKAGTVTTDLTKAIQELKGGKIEFKIDRNGVINNAVGKLSFAAERLGENIRAFLHAVARAKPASAKGHFLRSLVLSSTMGPGLKIDLGEMDIA
jgi:large subunit ribosomal protein L1